jgi:hypothetical protein
MHGLSELLDSVMRFSRVEEGNGVAHHTRADAEADNEHFDGITTE